MMKKSRLWAKVKIREELNRWWGVEGGIDGYGIKYILNIVDQLDEPEVTLDKAFDKVAESYAMTKVDVCRHLEQIDAYGGKVTYGEPEVLSQEWVDKNVIHIRGFGDIFKAEDVEGILVPKQELPVIPKYVANWITKHRKVSDLYPALKRLENNSLIWERIYEWYRENTHKFVNAYLTGAYEVEEEPLYYALIKGHESVTNEGDLTCKYWNFDTTNGDMFPSDPGSQQGRYLTEMSKEDWNKLGINDSNADFVKVEEMEE